MTKNNSSGSRNARSSKGRARDGVPAFVWFGLAGLLIVAAGLFVFMQASNSGSAGGVSAQTGTPAQGGGRPNLVVDRERIDFGRVPLDKPVKATFKLSNTGDRPLILNGEPQVQVIEGC